MTARTLRSILLCSTLVLALPACGGDGDGGGGADANGSGGGIDSAAAVDGLSGVDGAAALSVSFTVNKDTIGDGGGGGGGGGGGARNFRITEVTVTGAFSLGDPVTPGATDGHYHLYVDSTEPPDSYFHVDFGTFPGVEESAPIVWPASGPAATAGAHQLILSLRSHDHAALAPAVEASIPMTVVVP